MQDPAQGFAALDPAASDPLKVVASFDAMISRGYGIDRLLAGAAALAGAVCGIERFGRAVRYDPAGRRVADADPGTRFPERALGDGSVWLEREGAAHPDDGVILDRLAFAIGLIESRRLTPEPLQVVLDAGRTVDERIVALAQLRIEPSARIRLVAVDGGARPGPSTTPVPTRYGMLRALVDASGEFSPAEGDGRTGFGQWVRADHAPDSWAGAVIAHRLTTRLMPVVDVTDIGAMLILAKAHDPDDPHPDVRALTGLDDRSSEILRVLVESDSVRSAAAELAMHHSTLQARHQQLIERIGYDPRTVSGRLRYIAAEMLRRLGDD